MENQPNIPRRSWLRLSVGLAVGTVGTAFALTDADKGRCAVTPRQELGPFPAMQFRSQADHDVDLTQITGQAGIATGEVIIVKGQILDTSCQPSVGHVSGAGWTRVAWHTSVILALLFTLMCLVVSGQVITQ